jgi:hypothetical protein
MRVSGLIYNHYRNQGLAPITLGSDFIGKDVFAECQKILGKKKHSAKYKSKKNPKK